MAERALVNDDDNHSFYWSGLTGTDTGAVLPVPNGALAGAVHLIDEGSFAGEVSLEGSLDGGTTWAIMSDVQGSAATMNAAGDWFNFAVLATLLRVRCVGVTGAAQVRIKTRSN